MSLNADIVQNSIEQFHQFEKTINGASKTALHKRRKGAIELLEQLGLPDKKTENYKYTPITNRLKRAFSLEFNRPESHLNSINIDEEVFIPSLEANNIVLVNGRFSESLSNYSKETQQIDILDFEQACVQHAQLIDQHFGQYANTGNDAFTALNTAFAQDGCFILIKENTKIEKPIVIHHVSTDGDNAIQPRILVICEKNAQATIIEDFVSLDTTATFTNSVTEVVIYKDVVLNYYKLQLRNKGEYHVGNTHIHQAQSSTVNATTVTVAGTMTRNNLNIVIDDEHCEANMYGLYIASDDQHIDNQTMVDHKKANAYSNELYKGVMNDTSTGVFNGKIFVRQDAQKTNAFQSNKNILLSDNATINTKPQLEIWADDVKCSHGATTGQLDYEQMFYLRSRGIGKDEARALLLYAFSTDILDNIKIEALNNYIDASIKTALKSQQS